MRLDLNLRGLGISVNFNEVGMNLPKVYAGNTLY